MKKSVGKILILTMLLVLCTQIKLFAAQLTLVTRSDKDFYNLEENVIVTVDWAEAMQAASFTLKYDSTKLKFESANISDTYYNTETEGLVKVNWASMEEVDYTQMIFTFKAIGGGETQISVENPHSFANKDLVSPESIDCVTSGTKTITITAYGDVNLDGIVNSKDCTLLRRYIAGTYEVKLTEQQLINADVNLDGLINENDVRFIGNYIVKNVTIPTRVITGENIKTYDLDKDHQVISGFSITPNGLNKSEIIKNFNTKLTEEYEVRFFDKSGNELTSDNVGTGTVAKIGWKTEVFNVIQEYTILVYGDTTGDGLITPVDALAIIKDVNNKIPFTSEVYRDAGKVYSNADQELSAIDALAIIKSINGKYEINQSK